MAGLTYREIVACLRWRIIIICIVINMNHLLSFKQKKGLLKCRRPFIEFDKIYYF